MNNNGNLTVGIADDQAKDFDFEKTEMKYDSTGMFHWSPARNLEDCILVSVFTCCKGWSELKFYCGTKYRLME